MANCVHLTAALTGLVSSVVSFIKSGEGGTGSTERPLIRGIAEVPARQKTERALASQNAGRVLQLARSALDAITVQTAIRHSN